MAYHAVSTLCVTIASLLLCVVSCSLHSHNGNNDRSLQAHHPSSQGPSQVESSRPRREGGHFLREMRAQRRAPSRFQLSGEGASEPYLVSRFEPSSSEGDNTIPVLPPCLRTSTPLVASQEQPLVDLSKGLQMPGWNISSVQTACQTWVGLCCDGSGFVIGISTAGYLNQSGVIPASITQLTTLTALHIVGVNLSIPLPSFVGTLTQLRTLSFQGTSSNTTLFQRLDWVGQLTQLVNLSLSDTGLGGYLPDAFTNLVNLVRLDISRTGLDVFPCWINSLGSLQLLEAWDANVQGTIPTEIALLRNLTHLDLGHNAFFGNIPSPILNITSLRVLDISNNRLEGPIPGNISNLVQLQFLRLQNNTLTGTLPPQLFYLPNLLEAQLSFNSFLSPFPALNLSTSFKLTALNLSNNLLSGPLPTGVASIASLQYLSLANNNITALLPVIPSPLRNLKGLWMDHNQLTGSLDSLAVLAGLKYLGLSYNQFTGSFPANFSALVGLAEISVSHNNLSGPFPVDLLGLANLQHLDLTFNEFYGPLPDSLGLWKGPNLFLSHNNFSGSIPPSISNLTGLQALDLSFNLLSGAPNWHALLGTMRSVSSVLLNNNQFSGPLPAIYTLTALEMLNLANNSFSGPIPDTISNLISLTGLYLSLNRDLGSSLPEALSVLTSLRAMYAGGNQFSGQIPSFLGALTNLAFFSFANNRFTGNIPQTLCKLTSLTFINLANNSLYGEIPSCLYLKPGLRLLDASGNYLFGTLQNQFVTFDPDAGGILDLSGNYLYGTPPVFFNNTGDKCDGSNGIPSITAAKTISFPDIPVVYTGHSSLAENCLLPAPRDMCELVVLLGSQRDSPSCLSFCGTDGTQQCSGYGTCQASAPSENSLISFNCSCSSGFQEVHLPNGTETCIVYTPQPLSAGAIAGIVLASVVLVSSILLLWMVLDYRRKWLAKKRWRDLHVCTQFSLGRIEKATNNWNEANILGEGAYGTVYHGYPNITDGEEWAVKRAKLLTNEFEMEVRAMAVLNHKNLVRLLGFCADYNNITGIQEQILVYEFVRNGDLGMHLYFKKGMTPLSLDLRLKVAIGTAEGIAYLHSFDPPIIHRDIKPENILLDESFEPKIADFGLLKKMDAVEAATRVAGTPGYVDPEYNKSKMVSSKTDVYSLGVVLLEMITGNRPLIQVSEDENMPKVHIVQWVRPRFEDWDAEALQDPTLLVPSDAIMEVTLVAIDCVRSPAMARPEMKEIARRLEGIREKYRGQLDDVACPDALSGRKVVGIHQVQPAGVEAPLVAGGGQRRSGGGHSLSVPQAVPEEGDDDEEEALSARFDQMRAAYEEDYGSALELRFQQVHDSSNSWIEEKGSLRSSLTDA